MRFFLLGALLALVSACSQSSDDSGSGNTTPLRSSLFVVVDTAADTDFELITDVDVAALQRGDLSYTESLQAGRVPIRLAHPSGNTGGIELRNVPPGTYVALILQLTPGSLRAVYAGGNTVAVDVASLTIRIPFDGPITFPGPHDQIVLRHDAPITLGSNGSALQWDPRMSGGSANGELIRVLSATVRSVNQSQMTAVAELSTWGGVSRTLLLGDTIVLDPPGSLTPPQWLALLAEDDEVLFDGLLLSDRRIRVNSIRRLPPNDRIPGRGSKNDVIGTITQLLPATNSFRLLVHRIIKAGLGFPGPAPLELEVVVDSKTNVRWFPNRRYQLRWSGYGLLHRGMIVEVEWHGPPTGSTVTAHKIDIKGGSWGNQNDRFRVIVETIDPTTGDIVLVPPPGAASISIANQAYPRVIAEIWPETVLAMRRPTGLTLIEVTEIVPGQQARLLTSMVTGNRVSAAMLVVE